MSKVIKKILVVGGDSFIGKRLCKELSNLENVEVFSVIRGKNLDHHTSILLSNFDLVTNPTNKFDYLIKDYTSIIFLSGITNAQFIAKNYSYANLINVQQSIKWINFLAQNRTPVIFPSSSLVYDSLHLATEESKTLPISAYGVMKLEVETLLKKSNLSAAIPRFTKIISIEQPLIQKWIRSLRRKEIIEAYSDCQISPLTADQSVSVLIRLALDDKLHNSGLINISGASDVSFFHFAKLLAVALGFAPDLVKATDSNNKFMSKQTFATLQTLKASKLLNYYPKKPEQVIEVLRSEFEKFEK